MSVSAIKDPLLPISMGQKMFEPTKQLGDYTSTQSPWIKFKKSIDDSIKNVDAFLFEPALKSIDYYDFVKRNNTIKELIESSHYFDENTGAHFLSKESVSDLNLLRAEIVNLARLPLDWYGEGSVVPEQKVVDDLLRVLGSFPYNVVMPEIEVDDEGGVSLRWMAKDKKTSFTLGCRGTGNVVGTLVSLNDIDEQAWKLPVTENINLANKLAFSVIDDLVKGES